ncbi:MAG TPA: PIN domain nuclease [Gammaproteobacteria bacterium]|nr:PIN domain nuclease [Gammaproteobacteria bacterium]
MILVDSSVWIDYFNGVGSRVTDLLDTLVDQAVLLVGDLILIEVLQGFREDKDFNTAKKLLQDFLLVELVGAELAVAAAENYRTLRKKGVTVRKTIDVIIATYCIQAQVPLLQTDRDFKTIAEHLPL